MFKTRFISMLVLLMVAVTGAWATITVTINQSDWGSGDSFTKDGVTVSAAYIDSEDGNIMGPGTFSTTLGNFTKIVVTSEFCDAYGEGWSSSLSSSTWAGTPASTVSFNGNFTGMGETQTTIVCTIEPATTVVASGNCGTSGHESDVTWSLTDDGTLTISGTGAMDDEAPWSAYQDNITSVVIEDGVTSVGARAFTWCSNLTSVSLPASLEAIGAMAFARCGLTSITLPASLETIGMRAFQDTKITSVNIPASVASIDELAFGYCGSLAEITVADGNTVYEAPNGCNALIVKATHTLIQGCNGTVFANLPADLKSIGEAAFAGCTSLTTVTFPDGLESIGGNAFESCSGLTTVTIPASVNTVDVNAFAWCDNLTTVTIYATSLTTYGEGAFYDAASGLKIYVPYGSGDTYKAGWADYASKIEEMAAPTTYTVSLKEGTDDATSWKGKAGEAEYQDLPLEGVAAGTAVTVKYNGTKKVKSVKAKKKAPAGPPSWKLTLSSPAKDLCIIANGGVIAQHTLDVASTEFTVEMPELTSQTVNIVATDGSGNCWYCTQENMSFAIGQTYQSSPTMTPLGTESSADVYKMTGAGTIPAGKTVVLSDVTISGGQIACDGDANIILMGTNTVTANGGQAAIKIGDSGTTLTITGSGSLTATGSNGGAGIGTDRAFSASVAGGNIVINGGTVTATGGTQGAGIGTGLSLKTNTCGDITINGGTVIAQGVNGGAGIGTGLSSGTTASNECGAITIGTGVISVTAKKSSDNPGPNSIGKGRSNNGSQTCGTITIGGTIYWDGSAYQNGGETYLGSDITYPTAP